MRETLAARPNPDEKQINTQNCFRFEAYLAGGHEKLIFDLLDPKGVFLGKLNRYQFISWLSIKFKALNFPMVNCEVKRFISLDCLPGSEVISIKFKNLPEDFNPFNGFEQHEFVEDADLALNLVLGFNNGKINRIFFSRKFKKQYENKEYFNN